MGVLVTFLCPCVLLGLTLLSYACVFSRHVYRQQPEAQGGGGEAAPGHRGQERDGRRCGQEGDTEVSSRSLKNETSAAAAILSVGCSDSH